MALVNIWHLRRVAETAAKPCDICFKPATSVLITPDNKDHFYVCPGHLKDKGFCSPIVDEAQVAAKKRKEEVEEEIKIIKKEYEEKMKLKKKDKDKAKAKDEKDGERAKTKDGHKTDESDEKMEKEKDEKIKAITQKETPSVAIDEIPRIYALHKVFYQKRLDRLRSAEIARRNRERLKSPTLFPSVPTGDLT